ncbi:amidohydrolase [Tamlana sp. s12]|uniref:amidohydrolase n=1 Tax=Tamlana sp. s12 TaxID=1630406 RepID=UPI000800B07E|nr:amidohydrolase [Tamlana sp. s12]OBQ57278.1 amidohydrolase [Tamlana sp. s12]QQY82531.1 amidohydrolase [Tamlana sp. s12]
MQNQLKVSWIQADLVWENPKQNRAAFSKHFESLSDDTDLVVLPEMFSTGFTMHAAEVAETMEGETVSWLKHMASTYNTAITGSLVISEDDNYYNRLLFVEPSGKITYYNKRHTFTLVGEEQTYTAGAEKIILDYKGWKICPLICYDLRFPVWARNTEDYDLLIYVANWPKPRILAWDTLLKARAIENMSYCIGVNRVGIDGVNAVYSGHSAAYDVLGNLISELRPNEISVETVTLEKRHIEAYRNKFKFLNDQDRFTIL